MYFALILVSFFISPFFKHASSELVDNSNSVQSSDQVYLQIYPCKINDPNWIPSITVVSVLLSPSIPTIPGPITISALVEVHSENISHHLNAESIVKLMLPIGGLIPIGCTRYNENGCGGLGSCKYCNLLGNCYQPENVINDQVCKPKIGQYRVVVHRNIDTIPLAANFFGIDAVAMWEIELKVVDELYNSTLGCGVVYVFSRFKL